MRKTLTVAVLTFAAAAAAVGPATGATAATVAPKGNYYGSVTGNFKPVNTSTKPCPLPAPAGTTSTSPNCSKLTGTFTVAATGGKTLKGTFSGVMAGGDLSGNCEPVNAAFTFTTTKGNSFTATVVPATGPTPSPVNQLCIPTMSTGPSMPIMATDTFGLQITGGTGIFKHSAGTVSEYGAILPNLSPSGSFTQNGRTIGNINISLS